MRLSFIYPLVLWLLLLLPLLWAFTFAARSVSIARLGPWRFWALLVLRSVALVALVLALAGTQLVRPVDDLTVVFLIDGSDSVSSTQREQAVEYVNTALANRRPGDQAAVVVFGRNALVERAPSDIATLGRLTSTVVASRTNIEEAIQLGMALFPADAQKRMVLISDGRENDGRAIEAAQLARVRGVPIDVIQPAGSAGADVLLGTLDAPAVAREGQDITLQARIQSGIATSGRLQIFVNNELIGTQEVQLQPGTTTVPIAVPGGETGFARYEVRLEAQGDTQPLNNGAAAFTNIQGPPRVLLITGDPARAAAFDNALRAANVRTEVLAPNQVPADQARLKQYAAVVLVDVLAREVPRSVQQALPLYVREQGGSLAMIGGRKSFGAGGWRRSPVAEALPVELDPKDKFERPNLALGLVIDRSGSMSENAGVGVTKLDLAKEAVFQSILGLEQNDQVGIVAFDSTGSWVLNMQKLPDVVQLEQALSQISDGGGTNIRSGIEPAAQSLAVTDARVKHIILLTDGLADSNYSDLISQMRSNQVTITVVSIGQDANPALEQIAQLGGGRYYRVNNLSDVPRIFLAETVIVAGRDIVEETFTPAVVLNTPVVRGLGGLLPLHGYNATEPRPTARNILISPDGKPILAQWQYGLGRSVAWTSDFNGGGWARDWVAWSQFPRFAGGLIDALLPPQQTEGLALQSRTDGPNAVLELTAQNAEGQPLESASIQGRLLDPTDQGLPLTFSQVGAGRYRAVVPADTPGVYLAQVAVLDERGQPLGNVSGGLVVSYSPEYAGVAQGTPPLLPDLANFTGGRVLPDPTTIFMPTGQAVGMVEEIALPLLWLALILWPLDIALRRLLLRRSDFAPVAARLRNPFRRSAAQPTFDPTMSRLQAARDRARVRGQRAGTPGSAAAAYHDPPVRIELPPAAPPVQPRPTPAKESSPPAKEPAKSPPPAKEPPAPTPANPDDALASLLAAKQRARRKGQQK